MLLNRKDMTTVIEFGNSTAAAELAKVLSTIDDLALNVWTDLPIVKEGLLPEVTMHTFTDSDETTFTTFYIAFEVAKVHYSVAIESSYGTGMEGLIKIANRIDNSSNIDAMRETIINEVLSAVFTSNVR